MRDTEFWAALADTLDSGRCACLVIMVDATGDGPNRPGARMMIAADGRRAGTVGGGVSELRLVKTAQEVLSSCRHSRPRLITLHHRDSADVADSGMICSGSQVFALVTLAPDDVRMVWDIALADEAPVRIVVTDDGMDVGKAHDTETSTTFDADVWRYEETIGMADTVALVGGGHVSFAVSPLLSGVGFRVIVLDNRPGLETMRSNRAVHERHVIEYEDVAAHVPTGPRSYVCIMTATHDHDEAVLRRLVDLDLAYLGMMGSSAKIRTIFEHLRSDGVSRAALDRVHAPIGLDIGSRAPEEIAISIAAEIVAVRNGVVDIDS